MRALIQRVKQASVTVEGECTGSIQKGILVLLGIAETSTIMSGNALLGEYAPVDRRGLVD